MSPVKQKYLLIFLRSRVTKINLRKCFIFWHEKNTRLIIENIHLNKHMNSKNTQGFLKIYIVPKI